MLTWRCRKYESDQPSRISWVRLASCCRQSWMVSKGCVTHMSACSRRMNFNRKDNLDRSSEAGSVLVEFSLMLPILVLLLVGVADLGLGVQQAIVVSEAAHAGTAYSSLPGKSSDTAGMKSAANAAAGSLSSFNASATNWCSCGAGGTHLSCPITCSGGSLMEYAQVTTTATVPVLLGYPGLPAGFSLSGFSVVRVH